MIEDMETSEATQLELIEGTTEPVASVEVPDGLVLAPARPSWLRRLLGHSPSQVVTLDYFASEMAFLRSEIADVVLLHGQLKASYIRLRKLEKRLSEIPTPPADPSAQTSGEQLTKAQLRTYYAQQRMKR